MRYFFRIIFLSLLMVFHLTYADVQLQSGLMMPVAKNIQPFALQRYVANPAPGQSKVQPFTNDNLKGQWTLLFFGFTNCPALCPTTMAQLANAYQTLQQQNFTPMPQVVFVSIDPERDTLTKVNTFATTFNPNFMGTRTDDMKTLGVMTHEMNAMFEKVVQPASITGDKDTSSTYTINHTGDIMVLSPQGQFVAMLTMPHQASDIVADYQTIVKNAAPNQLSGLWGWLKQL